MTHLETTMAEREACLADLLPSDVGFGVDPQWLRAWPMEQTVTEAVIAKVEELCQNFFLPDRLLPIAVAAVEAARKTDGIETQIQSLQGKIKNLTACLDKMYMDRLGGLLADDDFERLYQRVRLERAALEEKLQRLQAQRESAGSADEQARELVQRYLASACSSRELLASLIERIELTENKQIIIKFRFREPEAIS